ncbi:RNA polymerase sigma factor [Sphingomonas endophytica]|uniref:FecI sigma-24 factor n=1 Tax=Sphingomonas endophytica TaxID=869719 RepID=A0A147I7Y9_9SPHN|nr:sigma-70 family RNA polymerase sigma factor [Sphingomonas endophytica]KTT75021.1 hypothetical protein NS334_04045 [Sphingomonas endophytica]
MSDPRSDADLVAQALAGRPDAFAAIMTRHKATLHRLIARIIGDEEEAVDVLQDAFIAAHGALGRYDPARPLVAWLTRIAVNKARDWRRRRLVRRLVSAVFPDHAAQIAADVPAIDTLVGDRAELARVAAAIDTLPARLREVLVLRGVEHLSQADTAAALGISEKAVETRLYRARQRLRAALP